MTGWDGDQVQAEQGVLFSEIGEGTVDNTDVSRALWLKDPMFSVLQEARPSGAARGPGEVSPWLEVSRSSRSFPSGSAHCEQ